MSAKWNPDTDPDVLRYRREREQALPRLTAKREAALAELRAILQRVEAQEAEAKKGGRPSRKGLTILAKASPRPKTFKRPEELVHGTRYAYYDRKCRCEACEGWKAAQRSRSDEAAARTKHGTRTRYAKGCRCLACKQADATFRRELRAARKAA